MDQITIIKLLTHLAYPAGLVGMSVLFALVYLIVRNKVRTIQWFFIGSCIFMLASNPIISSKLLNNLEKQYPQQPMSSIPKADAIVVLGGSLRPPTYPRKTSQITNSSDRFWYAAKLYKAGKAKTIVLTGGNVFPDPSIKSEAFYIKKILLSLGIPEKAILLEESSRTTEENAFFSTQLLEKHNFKKVLLVTSAMHMPRAMKLFDSPELTITPCSADVYISPSSTPNVLSWIPNAKAFSVSTLALHEYYGVWFYKIKTNLKSFFNS